MSTLWPWLAVAGLGALHGINPAAGWMFAAAWGVRAGDRRQALQALMPIAAGHVVSIALAAAMLAFGLSMHPAALQTAAGMLLAALLIYRFAVRKSRLKTTVPATHAGLAVWSFMMATAHGAGMMLGPALIPICMGEGPMRRITASGSLLPALAAVGVHTAAMLIAAGLSAALACRGFDAGARLLRRFKPRPGRPQCPY